MGSQCDDNLVTALVVEIYGNFMSAMTFRLHRILPLLFFPVLVLVQSSPLHTLYSMSENATHQIEKDHQLTTLPGLGREFRISFDLWVEEYLQPRDYNSRYGNILHLTPGVKGASSGGKTLLIKIWAGGFEVSSAIESSPAADAIIDYAPPVQKWTRVE